MSMMKGGQKLPPANHTGVVRGAGGLMPTNHSTKAGMPDNCVTDGCDMGQDATNSRGSMGRSTASTQGARHVPVRQRRMP